MAKEPCSVLTRPIGGLRRRAVTLGGHSRLMSQHNWRRIYHTQPADTLTRTGALLEQPCSPPPGRDGADGFRRSVIHRTPEHRIKHVTTLHTPRLPHGRRPYHHRRADLALMSKFIEGGNSKVSLILRLLNYMTVSKAAEKQPLLRMVRRWQQ